MKKITAIILASIMLLVASMPAFAYISGDTDNDFEVTATDARFALRLAVGLEKCNKKSDQFKAADADGNGSVTAQDARLILRAAVGLEAFADNTAVYGDIRATKMPYTTNGLTINSLTFDEYGSIVLSITNNTEKTNKAVKNGSYIPYKLYDSDGKEIDSRRALVSKMNPGESCLNKIYPEDGTAKIIFGAATVYLTDLIPSSETTVINGITVTKPPFEVNGIKIDSIEINTEYNQLTAIVTNNTGKTIYGCVDFLSYDANGNSLDICSILTQHLNVNEKGCDYFYFSPETAKIIFTGVSFSDRAPFVPFSTETFNLDGYEVPKSPINFNGINISVQGIDNINGIPNRPALFLKITNNTGKVINLSSDLFYYKQYDADGHVIACDKVYSPELSPGGSSIISISFTKDAAKILLGDITQ